MKKSLTKKVAELIEDRVGFFNGWGISEQSLKQTCYDTAKLVIQAVRRAPTKRVPDRAKSAVKKSSSVAKRSSKGHRNGGGVFAPYQRGGGGGSGNKGKMIISSGKFIYEYDVEKFIGAALFHVDLNDPTVQWCIDKLREAFSKG